MEKIRHPDEILDGRYYLATEKKELPRTIITTLFLNTFGIRSFTSYEDNGKHWTRELETEKMLRDYVLEYDVVEITKDQALCLVHNWKR